MAKRVCVLCGEAIKKVEEFSSYRIEGDLKGFAKNLDFEKAFHNACLTRPEGINEIARAQVLDYIEAVQFNQSIIEELKTQNLQRAESLLKALRFRAKYDKKP